MPSSMTYMRATLIMLLLVAGVAAQPETFRAGDTVETNDGRVCKVLTITGRSARVACGTSRSEIRVYSFDSITSEARAAARREELERQRANGSNRPRTTTVTFNVGDTVQMPNGKIGKIESLIGEVANVKSGTDSDFVVVQDLKKIETEPQRAFRVGDSVVAGGQPGVVEELSPDGKGAKVKFGPGKYDFKWVPFVNMRTPDEGRNDAAQKKMATVFAVEAKPYLLSVEAVEQFFNPKAMDRKGTGIDPESRKKVASDLAELDRICTTKYSGIKNESWANPTAEVPLYMRKGDQCSIAQDREQILKKAKARYLALSTEFEINRWLGDLRSLKPSDNGYRVHDDVQKIIYNRQAWENEKGRGPKIKQEYAAEGEVMPVDAFAPLYKVADEVKEKIAADAPTRSWTGTKSREASLEAAAARKVSSEFPGARVFKSGMTDSAWGVEDTKTEIASTNYGWRLYRVNKGAYRYRTGQALIQLPGQPFCQIRQFEVTQYKAGGGYGASQGWVSDTGTFVSCQ